MKVNDIAGNFDVEIERDDGGRWKVKYEGLRYNACPPLFVKKVGNSKWRIGDVFGFGPEKFNSRRKAIQALVLRADEFFEDQHWRSDEQRERSVIFGRKAKSGFEFVIHALNHNVVEQELNTPYCCDVQFERYFCM